MGQAPGIRLQLLGDLVAHLRGPGNGRDEVLDSNSDPRALYLVGVLAPEPHDAGRLGPAIPLDEPAAIGEETAGEEREGDVGEDQEDGEVGRSPISPVLAPDRLPRSIGITVAVPPNAHLRLAASWAIYRKEEDRWRRLPRAVILPEPVTVVDGLRRTVHLGPTGPIEVTQRGAEILPKEHDAEVSLDIRARKADAQRILVTVHMVNLMRERPDRAGSDSERHVYQPQIRVTCDCELLPVILPESGDPETRKLAFLHRHHTPKARGHLCSAVWREIDPEAFSCGEGDRQDPFEWVDGTLLSADERQKFSPPDARTELLPVFHVSSPSVDWPDGYSPKPELSAGALAESPEPAALVEKLRPLVTAYRDWVRRMHGELGTLAPEERSTAGGLIAECEDLARRMEKGLELLESERDAWLSFCFACRAMDLQYSWARRSGFVWRPFQLAFVLACLESVVNEESPDRKACDLLWVPTGSGKTEAYLGLAAFTAAWRRRRALRAGTHGAGTCVISRYTLRLLTVQQFRRVLRLVTACEYLRVHGAAAGRPIGWRPEGSRVSDDFLWGTARFSIGLWVGGDVTPNRLQSVWPRAGWVPGALDILTGKSGARAGGDPAQVTDCPVCGAILAVGELEPGDHTLHWVVRPDPSADLKDAVRKTAPPEVTEEPTVETYEHGALAAATTVSVAFHLSEALDGRKIDDWLRAVCRNGSRALCARGSRPGYFVKARPTGKGGEKEVDFDIFCPNPACPLNRDVLWMEGAPCDASAIELVARERHEHPSVISRRLQLKGASLEVGELRLPSGRAVAAPDRLVFRGTPGFCWPVPVSKRDLSPLFLSTRIPIPAYTVDEQVYGRCPTIVVATADKFARLPFEPRAAALFGNVDRYHPVTGYFREGLEDNSSAVPKELVAQVRPLDPPDLIVQDELHLLEGPLGSLAGLYELAVDTLSSRRAGGPGPKYIAATATTRNAREQVAALFSREARLFPPHGIQPGDRFFVRSRHCSPREEATPGQLYVGLCAPGRGPLTPLVRTAARLMQTAWEIRRVHGDGAADPYWTLVLYFNAIRELAGARSLYSQDIPEWLKQRLGLGGAARPLHPPDEPFLIEISSRRPSSDLPRILAQLETALPEQATDVILTTSMFGTGVDVPRLSAMVVQGQPKTTSAYIQATGRVGRSTGALVVTLLRASRPRDLSHYEFFCGYHARLHSFVEPVPVMPFSDGAMDRSCGPVCVAILRNVRSRVFGTHGDWHYEEGAREMRTRRTELRWLEDLFVDRARRQPVLARPAGDEVRRNVAAQLDRWQQMAELRDDLRFVEYTFGRAPAHYVVLGEPSHSRAGKCVFESVPQSLREVEDSVEIIV